MPTFAPDFTPRYIAHYVSAGIPHRTQVRVQRGQFGGVIAADAEPVLASLVAALQALLPADFAWTSGETIDQDTSVSAPSTVPANPTGAVAVADMSPQDKISHITFVGRNGRSTTQLRIFGVQFTPDVAPGVASSGSLFRLNPGVVGDVDAAIAVLQGGSLVCNNNLPVTWSLYANLKVNDKWLRQVRKGLIT